MDKLVFTALGAATNQSFQRVQLTNDLANVSTIGYKKSTTTRPETVSYGGNGLASRYQAVTPSRVEEVDLEPGHHMQTGNPLDIAMNNSTVLGVQSLEGEVAFGRFGSQHILHRLKRHITGRGDHQLRFLKIDLGAGILEVITVANITTNLIKGVHQLLTIKVRDHIEGISAGHVANLSILQFRNPSISSRVWPT